MNNKRTRGLLSSCIVILLVISLFTSCDLAGIGTYLDPHIVETDALYIGGNQIVLTDTPKQETPGYRSLSEEQKKIYDAAVLALESGETKFVYTGVDYRKYLEIYGEALFIMLYDHPEFFWVNGEAEANAEYPAGSNIGNISIELSVYDYWKTADLDAARSEFERASQIIVSDAEMRGELFEKVLYVHDRIIRDVIYDYESFESGSASDDKTDAFTNTAYGALVDGRALCGGYARAFSHIMHRLGIESLFITGEADGGPHAWNLVNLDNEYYHIDLTWDDMDGDPCDVVYNYFCITDEEISNTHKADNNTSAATSDKYNYYVRKSLYLGEYDFDSVSKMFFSRDDKSVFSFKCASRDVFDAAIDDLIDGRNLDMLELPGESSYYIDKEQYIITFIFS